MQSALRRLIREIVAAVLLERPRVEPLITVLGRDTRGPASSMAKDPKAMVSMAHTREKEEDDSVGNEEGDDVRVAPEDFYPR